MTFHEVTIGDYFDVKHGYAFKGEYFTNAGPYIVVTPGNFFESGEFRFREGKEKFYVGEFPESFLLEKDDLIIAMTQQGPGLLGSSAMVPDDNQFLHNQRIGLVTNLDESKLCKRFLYYLLNTRPVRGQIEGSATGSKVKHTAPKRIKSVRVKIPSLTTQNRVASILAAYDKLLGNNRRRIALLKEAGQQLYKEWFVRLQFPGYESTKIVDCAPVGWSELTVSDWLASHIGGGWGEDTLLSDHTEPGFVIRGTDLPKVALGQIEGVPFRFHTASNIKSRTLSDGDIVFEVSGGSKGQSVGRSLLISSDILESFDSLVICASFCKKLRPVKREYAEYINLHLQYIREVGFMDVFATQSASNITNFKFASFLPHSAFVSTSVPRGASKVQRDCWADL
jgi:type I restriction enzyme S subunit